MLLNSCPICFNNNKKDMKKMVLRTNDSLDEFRYIKLIHTYININTLQAHQHFSDGDHVGVVVAELLLLQHQRAFEQRLTFVRLA